MADAVLGEDIKFVSIGKEAYGIKPPSIEIILRAIRHLSNVRLASESYTRVNIIAEYPQNTKHITRALAVLILGKDGRKAKKLSKTLMRGTYHELLVAYNFAIQMMGGDDFFALAQLAKSLLKVAARPK